MKDKGYILDLSIIWHLLSTEDIRLLGQIILEGKESNHV